MVAEEVVAVALVAVLMQAQSHRYRPDCPPRLLYDNCCSMQIETGSCVGEAFHDWKQLQ